MEIIKVDENDNIEEQNISRRKAERQVRALYPNTSLPRTLSDAFLHEHGYVFKQSTEKPEGDVVTEGDPEKGEDGLWYQTWDVRDFTPEELEQQQEELQQGRFKEVQNAVQSMLDAKAREREYSGILSLCSYATSTNAKFAAEAQAGVDWRDACWDKCYEILNEVQDGTRGIPSVADVLSEMPEFTWPT